MRPPTAGAKKALEFAAVLVVDIEVVFVNTPIAQVDTGSFRSHAGGLHQDGGLLHLFMSYIGVMQLKKSCLSKIAI